jgi:pimeloyl-ACP methyl ester carboxylesterase
MNVHTDPQPASQLPQPPEDPPAAGVVSRGRRQADTLLRAVGSDRRLAWAVTLLAAGGYGAITGWWTPRGPLSALEGLSAMVLGLLVGAVAGFLLRTRWAMLVAPVTFAAAFELVRVGVSGPTVDGVHLTSTYGIIAFLVGRGVHGLLALLPLVLGASVGAAMARRRLPTHRRRGFVSSLGLWLHRGVAGVTALALVALAALVARPATTAPIVDAGGRVVAGSVAELTRVEVGGHDLALMIRGRSVRNPVLLFLAGGPGGSELGAMRRHSQALEDDFVVATLDQRGAGKSYDQLDPAGSLTLDRAVADTLEVSDYLRQRFGQSKVYLVGQSWGSLLGVLAVQRRPELFSAFVGVGQMVDPTETDQIFYRDTLAWARRSGDAGLVARLTRSGPPPYTSMLDYEPALAYEQQVYPYSHAGNSEGAGQMGENIFVGEYTQLEQLHLFGGFMDTFSVLYPQIQDVDLRTQATSLAVPVYLAQGAHEAPGRAEPAKQWFDLLQAPSKRLVTFATSGHRPLWEQPAQFHDLMTSVLAETATSTRTSS